MSDHLRNFQSWYSNILEDLSHKENAGLAMLIIAFPLLERYLREKSGAYEDNHLTAAFFDELRKIFPALSDDSVARNFWTVFRHGLLHQVALSEKAGKADAIFRSSGEILMVDPVSGRFELDPVQFVTQVIKTIETDFDTFKGRTNVDHPQSKVHVLNSAEGSGASEVLGTRGDPRARMRIIFHSSSGSSSNPLTIFNPKKIGVGLMVSGLLVFLVAQIGLDLPMIVEVTRDFEGPDGIISYHSAAIHWLCVIEIVTFVLGLCLFLYGLFQKTNANLAPKNSATRSAA